MRLLFFITLILGVNVLATQEQRTCKMGREYWLYTPDTIDKNKTYWLVVGVHGAGGDGKRAANLQVWTKKFDNVIVVGPTFPKKGPYYQVLGGNSDKQLLDIHKTLSKEFKLHNKLFIYGFSGGSQYAHRFANKHYKRIIGVSAHSGGTWDRGPSRGSAGILWTLS
jgi:poly(3-hydroxybutyrate) depolymerase